MVAKNLEGKVPEHGELTAEDEEILSAAKALLETSRDHYSRL
jgi:methionyl-tRNA synthetase